MLPVAKKAKHDTQVPMIGVENTNPRTGKVNDYFVITLFPRYKLLTELMMLLPIVTYFF